MLENAQTKCGLRKAMTLLRNGLSQKQRDDAALALVQHSQHPPFSAFLPPKGGVIAGYVPIKSEIDPRPLMHKLYAEGLSLALPRVEGADITFHAYHPADTLERGAYGIAEPAPHAPRVSPALILTPLLAYDAEYARLGYGKGYYDRAFLIHPQAKRLGLAYACQRVEHVPREAHDALLDGVLAV